MNKPKAVLIGDIHYNLSTLALADTAVRQAINTANDLNVPLVVAGDLHDNKANMRAECVNAMIETFSLLAPHCYILVGNHDKTHEKAETNALNFLQPYAEVLSQPIYSEELSATLIPYQTDTERFKRYLPDKGLVICHQGIQGSDSGEYIQDHSAVDQEHLADLTVISGHYHRRQVIPLTNGSWTYLGNPYTLGYGEADHPPKGYHILHNDNSLEFVPLDLRRHVVTTYTCTDKDAFTGEAKTYEETNLNWIKLAGDKELLAHWPKERMASSLGLKSFRYDLIPTDTKTEAPDAQLNLSGGPLIDSLVDSLSATSADSKERLKALWRGLK